VARYGTGTASRDSGRIAGLDGLRGAAVIAVLAFHFGVPGVVGGFLGVDVFFVLSGFLITSLLLSEWDRGAKIDLRRFWGRRARRLLPGLATVLIAIAVWAVIVSFPDPASVRGDAIATLAYVANWRYIVAHRGYFAQYGPPSPLAHTWSLAIEEQFYLVWPLVAIAILPRWGVRGVRNVAAAGAVASAGLCAGLFALGTDTDRLYYGTDTRAQAILIGAALAGALTLRRPRVRPASSWTVASVVGAGVLLAGCHALRGTSPILYAGGFTVVALAAAAVIAGVVTAPGQPLGRALSWRPLRATGVVSYELYLWHWPVLVALTAARTGLEGVGLFAARVLVTVVLATGCWALIDNPILTGRLRLPQRPSVRLVSIAATGVAAVLVVTAIGTSPSSGSIAAVAPAAFASVPSAQSPLQAVLLGDSVALTLGDGLLDRERGFGVDLVDGGLLGCGVLGVAPIRVEGVTVAVAPGCGNWETGWRRLVAQKRPAVVAILVGRWEVVDRKFDGRWTHIGDPSFDAFIAAQLDRAIDAAGSTGARVVVMTSPHFAGVERPDGGRWPEDDPTRVDLFNSLVRAAVARHGPRVTLFNLAAIAEPAGHYTANLDGIALRQADGIHFTQAGADLLAPAVLADIVHVARTS